MRGACEIVELKDEVGSSRYRQTRMQNRDQKPPLIKKGTNKFLQDDINKLFEAIDLRSTKSLDLSDRRNASKKPMRIGGSSSPGIGFSEPVSLKQALRGMCISQAAEMASTKRLLKPPGSPSMLEPGKVSTFYTSSDNRFEVSLVPEESTSNSSSFKLPWYIQDPKSKSASHSAHSSPRFFHKSTVPESTQLKTQPQPKVNHSSLSLQPETPETVQARKEHDSSVPNKGTKNPSKSVSTSPRVVTKTTPKVRKKGRVQTLQSSSATKSNKDNNSSIKTNSRPGKPAKSIVKKKEKHESPSNEVSGSTSQLTCQKCQCHVNNDHVTIPEVVNKTNSDISTPPPKLNKLTKTKEQGEFSQSSKSSIGEYSSSTTVSEESNLSGNGSGNRPHMSKDIRWEAIANVRKQHGFLGLSHFNLLKKLGSGDIGTVYLAELIGTNCFFAIKVMDNEFLVRRKKMTRAQTEREILRMLDHPFLPTLFAQFTSDNLSCLVMEFCPGGDLHVLRQKQLTRYFPEQAARFYVAEVLLALEYLHMLGIIYRDLKPENIMVREDGHIMLTDFDLSLRCSVNPTLLKSPLAIEPPRMSGPCAGSNCIDPFCAAPSCKVSCFTPRILPSSARARKLKADLAAQAKALPQLVAEPTEARSNSFVGTHEYLAPEIIKGDGHGSAVDWWTLGIFLYELLYGKTPFKGSGNEETLTNVVLQSLKFPDSPMVSFQARDLIRGLLIKEPENRFGTQTGAAEIKRHPFFDGLNWALIRCAIPPEIPEVSDVGVSDNERRFLECNNATGEHLEFELF